jgi:esterase/lipase
MSTYFEYIYILFDILGHIRHTFSMAYQKEENLKRINIMLREDQYQKVVDAGLNMSGLLRDLLDDHFSKSKITLSVTPKTKQIYDNLISNFGGRDRDIEPHFVQVMDKVLQEKIDKIDALRKKLK